tara:strand:+ start:1241 stop:1555 length:315 start_codon:yes stop_codon:yes gene_type:complete
MNIGKLDRKITIKSVSTTADDYGQEIQTFSTLTSVWARILYKNEVEKFENDQLKAISNIHFFIRYRTDITEQMRISYNNKTYLIEGISEIGRGVGLEIKTKLFE